MFIEGRVRMEEQGGRLFLEEGGGERGMNVIEEGKAI